MGWEMYPPHDHRESDLRQPAQSASAPRPVEYYEEYSRLQAELAHFRLVNKELEASLLLSNAQQTSLEETYANMVGELRDTQTEIRRLHSKLAESAICRKKAKDELATSTKELEDLKKVMNDLKKRHVKLAMELQGKRTKKSPPWPGPAKEYNSKMPRINGQVVGVSTKANIVIINKGEDDNVRIGFTFTIYRGKEYVAKMVIEKVYPNQAAGRVIEMSRRDKVLVGDKVVTRNY
jgi:hypothetical protein